ncbi:MAG: acyltransferase [Chitinophagaceae bacterium]|nr:acyltransferase [Chitinophagaceae bacterium]
MASIKYSPELDGLRGISILAVLITHYGLGVSFGGQFGVSLFFFISGLLITRILMAEYQINQTISLKDFYIKRMLRLYPALLMMLLVAYSITLFMNCSLQKIDLLASLFYFMNFKIAYWDTNATICSNMINPLWSLSVEEHFYLFFPLLCLIHLRNWRLFAKLLIGLITLALLVRLYYSFIFPDNVSTRKMIYMLTQTRFDSILFGCLAAILLQSKKSERWIAILSKPIYYFLAATVLYISFKIPEKYFADGFSYSVQGVCHILLVMPLIAGAELSFIKKLLTQKWLVLIGKMSYSFYLFHNIGISLAIYFVGKKNLSPKWLAVAIVPGITLALISYFLVEKNMIKFRKKFGSSAT